MTEHAIERVSPEAIRRVAGLHQGTVAGALLEEFARRVEIEVAAVEGTGVRIEIRVSDLDLRFETRASSITDLDRRPQAIMPAAWLSSAATKMIAHVINKFLEDRVAREVPFEPVGSGDVGPQ